jgi:hypothetical protein
VPRSRKFKIVSDILKYFDEFAISRQSVCALAASFTRLR